MNNEGKKESDEGKQAGIQEEGGQFQQQRCMRAASQRDTLMEGDKGMRRWASLFSIGKLPRKWQLQRGADTSPESELTRPIDATIVMST